MRDHSITINSISKTYSLTGWRVGWVIASESMTQEIKKVHDFLTVGAAAPLQEAAAFTYGEWHHVVYTWEYDAVSDTDVKLYIDNSLVDSDTFAGTLQTPDAGLFLMHWALDSQYGNGLLDDFRLYDSAIGAVDVEGLYNLGNLPATTTTTTTTL